MKLADLLGMEPRQLARAVRAEAFRNSVRSRSTRFSTGGVMCGYHRRDFEKAWEKMVAGLDNESIVQAVRRVVEGKRPIGCLRGGSLRTCRWRANKVRA